MAVAVGRSASLWDWGAGVFVANCGAEYPEGEDGPGELTVGSSVLRGVVGDVMVAGTHVAIDPNKGSGVGDGVAEDDRVTLATLNDPSSDSRISTRAKPEQNTQIHTERTITSPPMMGHADRFLGGCR
jgi:hypothetical protein